MARNGISAKLDWNRMLGFEQICDSRQSIRDEVSHLSAKVGGKVGGKVGNKVGTKIGVKAGIKA